MSLLPYDYLHLVNCPEVVTISDDYCIYITQPLVRILRTDEKSIETPKDYYTHTKGGGLDFWHNDTPIKWASGRYSTVCSSQVLVE